MASMTKKDFELLTDALVEMSVGILGDSRLLLSDSPVARMNANTVVREAVTNTFGNRLRYTSDSFDPGVFQRNFRDKLETALRKVAVKAAQDGVGK